MEGETAIDPRISDADLDMYLAAWADADGFDGYDAGQVRMDAAEASAIFTPRGIACAEARHFHIRERALATLIGRRRAPAQPQPPRRAFAVATHTAFRAVCTTHARAARDTLIRRLHGLVHSALLASRTTTSPVTAR